MRIACCGAVAYFAAPLGRDCGGALKSKARLELNLLGGFEAHLQGGAALVLPTRKTQALLAYLALPPGRSHPREKLATLLWGDMQTAQARADPHAAAGRAGLARGCAASAR